MKNQRGSAAIWAIVVLVIIVIAGAAYWYWMQSSVQPTSSTSVAPITQQTTMVTTSTTNPTSQTQTTSNQSTQTTSTQTGSAFSATPTSGTAPLTVTFNGVLSTSNPSASGGLGVDEPYITFGDNGQSGDPVFCANIPSNVTNYVYPTSCTFPSVSHTYTSPGTYTGVLHLGEQKGTQTTLGTVTITVQSSQQSNSNPSQPTSVPGMSEYTDSNFGFSFWYPSSWSVNQLPTQQSAPFGTTLKRLEISGGTQQNNIEIDEVQFSGTSLTVPNAGCTASYSFNGRWMETDSGCDGATDTPAPFNGSYTMGGLPTFLDQNGISTQSWIVPLSGSGLQNDLFVTPIGSFATLSPTVNTIVAANPSAATAQSSAQQTSAIEAEQSAYAGQ
jgi:PKD repeat protein